MMQLTTASIIITITIALFFFSPSKGSKLVYHNDASLPDELDLMELYIGEPPRPLRESKRAEQNTKATSGLWFGPRLGRRKRSVDIERQKRDVDEPNFLAKEEMMRLSQEWPWAYIALKEGKRRNANSNFIPRLGRDSDDELMENFDEAAFASFGRQPLRSSGTPSQNNLGSNFTPRLGRTTQLNQH